MERAWIIVSGICLIVAAVFLWRAHLDGAFVVATLGEVAWFLSLRVRLRRTTITAGDQTADAESYSDTGDRNED